MLFSYKIIAAFWRSLRQFIYQIANDMLLNVARRLVLTNVWLQTDADFCTQGKETAITPKWQIVRS
jgi:hypothetical protein